MFSCNIYSCCNGQGLNHIPIVVAIAAVIVVEVTVKGMAEVTVSLAMDLSGTMRVMEVIGLVMCPGGPTPLSVLVTVLYLGLLSGKHQSDLANLSIGNV